jgi:hypothetical protein
VTVPSPEACDARSSGACWWSAASWSSGTRLSWRSGPVSRSWRSRSGLGCPGRRCTGGRTATSPAGWRRWRIGRSGRSLRRGRCRRRWRLWSVRCAGRIRGGARDGSERSWPSARSSPTARTGCRTGRRSTDPGPLRPAHRQAQTAQAQRVQAVAAGSPDGALAAGHRRVLLPDRWAGVEGGHRGR